MKTPLNILHLEDDRGDATLVHESLKAAGISQRTQRVDTRQDFEAVLERGGVDLILSDFTLPAFDGMSALIMARTKCPGVPFILLSGSSGEEDVMHSMESGATDYVSKRHLSRLGPAVRRAVQDVKDRAERTGLQQQFVQAQKMEMVGQLAGGIAHDFNNILSVIMGYSDILLKELQPGDSMRGPMEEIFNASERAAALTRQLLIFSRNQKLNPVILDPREVIMKMSNMLRKLINEDIELSIVPGAELGHVKADPGYLGQVLMNLVVNARDAMPDGGRIAIEINNVSSGEEFPRGGSKIPSGNYVMLSVTDTGCGMPNEVKARMFEAFFTTKPKDRGTGLGLATCQSIVKLSGGHITVESEVGRGTNFSVYLPRVDEPVAPVHHAANQGALPRGTETLLVVEDQPAVRGLACAVLKGQGYNVLAAINGRDGLRVAKAHQGAPIRLVVTDVIMPQMNGQVMSEWLKTNHPDLQILFTSGYTDETISRHGVFDPGVDFLPKPYTPALLTRKVREMLDASQIRTLP